MSDFSRDNIRRVVQEVVAEVTNAPALRPSDQVKTAKTENSVRVLFLFNAGVRKLDEALEQVRLIEDTGVKSGVYTGPAARGLICGSDVRGSTGIKCILDTVRPEGVETVLKRATVLVLPTLCLTVAAKTARLISDDQESRLVLSALSQGKKVLAARDGFLISEALANEVIRQEIEEVLGKLEAFGMLLTPTALLNQAFGSIITPSRHQEGTGSPACRLITARVITNAFNNRQPVVTVTPGGIITPLARDLAKEYGVEVRETSRRGAEGPEVTPATAGRTQASRRGEG